MSRADNSVKIWRNLPISNPKTDLHNINAHTKFDENPLMFTQVIIWKWKKDRQMDHWWMDDWWMDRYTNVQRETIIPCYYRVAGYKKTQKKEDQIQKSDRDHPSYSFSLHFLYNSSWNQTNKNHVVNSSKNRIYYKICWCWNEGSILIDLFLDITILLYSKVLINLSVWNSKFH